MKRRTAFAIAATITTLGTGAVTAVAMSGDDAGLGRDGTRVEVVASPQTSDDSSPSSTRRAEAVTGTASDDTSTTTRTTAPTTTRSIDDNTERSTSTSTRTTAPPTGVTPTSNIATFRSVGGEVDVTWTARTLTIVAVRPAAGFRAQREEGDGDEVEAEFEAQGHDSKITVRLVNGSPSASVRERDDNDRNGDDNSSADDNSGRGGGTDDNSNSGHGSESNDDHGGRGRG